MPEKVPLEEQSPRSINPEKEEDILSLFSPEEQEEIKEKQQILSSLAYFIGKDFKIPVKLNIPGGGWFWDFQKNEIRIDPKDLLEKPMDYLRHVICHEGGHRRVSRADFIPLEEWRQPGFSFMMNAIEDPRNNNFVSESYPKYAEYTELAYKEDMDVEKKAKAAGELGFSPRFLQAGLEYIKQWFREVQGEDVKISEDLPENVKEVVKKTLESARDSWWRYPSREEADKGEEIIRKYAKLSYEINRDEVWPEFRKLVEEDIKDEMVEQMLQQLVKNAMDGKGLPQELKEMLTPELADELEKAINELADKIKKEAEKTEGEQESPGQGENKEGEDIEGEPVESASAANPKSSEEKGRQSESGTGGGEDEKKSDESGKVVDLESFSPELKQRIQEYTDSLPEGEKKSLEEKAREVFKQFEDEINEELQGKLADNPEKKEIRTKKEKTAEAPKPAETPPPESKSPPLSEEELKKYKELLAKEVKSAEGVYEQIRAEVLPLIDQLEMELREIFVERRARGWQSGFRTGKRIDIKRRIQEKARSIPPVESTAWQKRELPQEKDYAISLLVDLSGSMKGKIRDTFKAVIVLAEVLNRLSINLEILGFNDRLYEYQKFGEKMSREIRDEMGGMLDEVVDEYDSSGNTWKAAYNDDGWALEQTSERLQKQKEDQKFLIALSDGMPVESPMHPREKYELGKMVKKILESTKEHLIGLGIGPDTKHVETYYPNSIADVDIEDMPKKLAELIKEVIANYDSF